jgi:hypothetical protein
MSVYLFKFQDKTRTKEKNCCNKYKYIHIKNIYISQEREDQINAINLELF